MKIKTAYSFHNSIGSIENVANRLEECKLKSFPISDYLSTFGFLKWEKVCKEKNVKPVYGVQIPITQSYGNKKPVVDVWSFFAVNDLRPINDLVNLATQSPDKIPALLYSHINDIDENEVVIITGNLFPDQYFKEYSKRKNIYYGLTPSMGFNHFAQAKKHKFKFVACSENNYTNQGDKELYRSALGFRAYTQSYPQHILKDDEWKEALFFVDDKTKQTAIRNRNKLLNQCNAKIKKAEIFKPKRKKTLKNHCAYGAKVLGVDLKDPVYKARLDKELKLIKEKDFEDYFHIIIDLVSWAKTKMIVGPARGSSCGSLVCYLTGITTIDPIEYDLIFERFIDINRDDLPDIDIDFSDQNRQMVFDYAIKKFGQERVARLGTVNMFQPKSALKAVGGSLGVPVWELEKGLESLIDYKPGHERHDKQLFDTLTTTTNGKELLAKNKNLIKACELENNPSHAGKHAAGIVLTQTPIADTVAIDDRTGATMCDKRDAEKLNLLKIDCLGLIQLTIFERCLSLIGQEPTSQNGFLESIPLNDPKAFDVINQEKYSGVFQFEGKALQDLAKDVEFTDLNDLVAITALARPGPLHSGGAAQWVRRKNKQETAKPMHPALEPYTKETFGVLTYQEQVMKIIKEVGLLSWEDTSQIRKDISKTKGREALSKFESKFISGCEKNGLKEIDAKRIWAKMLDFGSYAFNKSHAVAYGLVSYYCCYLKAHYPLEFAAATLDNKGDPSKQLALLRELAKEGYKYKAFDINKSSDLWEIDKDNHLLIGPLKNIKGIGPAIQNEILDSRKTGEPLRQNLLKKLENARTEIDSLTPIKDSVKRFDLDKLKIQTKPVTIKSLGDKKEFDKMVIGVVKKVYEKNDNHPDKIKERGYKLTGPDKSLNIYLEDDSGEILCKISRTDFKRMAPKIMQKANVGKSLYAIKGNVPDGFKMLWVNNFRYIGEME